MGKYLRKPKFTGDVVAVMDVSQSSLGVRTRAKTLALQKLQEASRTTVSPPPEQNQGLSYLQLRSRKLEKPPMQDSSCCRKANPNPSLVASRLVKEEEIEANCDFGSGEAYFGENSIDFDGRERGTRESTPCSFIRDSNDRITPGSSTRSLNRPVCNRIMPTAQEIEEFFALHAQGQQRLFAEKYNFDIMNEKPHEGRYEWVRVQP